MPSVSDFVLSYDPSERSGNLSFVITWGEADGEVGTTWDMLFEFFGSDEGEVLEGSNDLLGRVGMITRIESTPVDRRSLNFSVSPDVFDEDPRRFIPFPVPIYDSGRDEVFAELTLLPVPRTGARARSNVIRGHF